MGYNLQTKKIRRIGIKETKRNKYMFSYKVGLEIFARKRLYVG